jgi:hypothetical protein
VPLSRRHAAAAAPGSDASARIDGGRAADLKGGGVRARQKAVTSIPRRTGGLDDRRELVELAHG